MKKTIVFIVGLGHSGTTLLGNILGSHSKILHIGELVSPIKKNKSFICRECLDKHCPIWGSTITKTDLLKEYKYFSQQNLIRKIFPSKNITGLIYSKAFNAFNDIDIIVDSSKQLNWYNFQKTNKDFNYKYIFLKRDFKPIIASYKRSYNRSVEEQIIVTKNKIKSINSFYNTISHLNKITIKYEDIVTSFESNFKEICKFLMVDYEKSMYKFNDFKHHLIGGNQAGYLQKSPDKAKLMADLVGYDTKFNQTEYYSSFSGLQIDNRWKSELNNDEIKLIDSKLKYENAYQF